MIGSVLVIAEPSARGDGRLSRLVNVLQGVGTVTVQYSDDKRIDIAGDLVVLYGPAPTAFDRRMRRQLSGRKVLCCTAADFAACHEHGLDAFLVQHDAGSAAAVAALLAFCRRPVPRRSRMLPARLVEHLRKRSVVAVPPRPARTLPDEPLVSIVTVVRNDAPGLSKTLRSVFEQSRQDFEYLVLDGASTDDTADLVRTHASGIDRWISEPDRGPYDAMTKGARLARGRFVLFMNAGDEFVGELALEEALHDVPADAEIVYGHHFYLRRNGRCLPRPAADLNITYARLRDGALSADWMTGIPCHQSTFIARRRLVEDGFDPRLRVAADHALLFGLMARGCKAHHTGTYVARYVAGGMSRKHLAVCQSDWEHIALQHTRNPEPVRAFYAAMHEPRGLRRAIGRFAKRP